MAVVISPDAMRSPSLDASIPLDGTEANPSKYPADSRPADNESIDIVELKGELASLEQRFSEAREEIANLTQERETAWSEAREQGFGSGRDEARTRVETETQASRQAIRAILEELSTTVDAYVPRVEELALKVAYAAVCKICGAEAIRRGFLLETVGWALQEFESERKITLRVNAEDAQSLGDAGLLSERPGIILHVDKELKPGDCIIETAATSLDASMLSQLARLKEVLLATYQEAAVADVENA